MARRRYFRDAGPVKRTRVNHMIRITPIRLIDENDNQAGLVETPDALRMAEEAGLDLVEVVPDSRPPVCKIMDYGKFKYDQSKKEQRSRAAQKQAEMKEIRLGRSVKIDPHDVQIRLQQARKFLLDGHKVQIVQQFRGREMQHRALGMERLQSVVNQLEDIAKVEVPPRSMGRRTTLIMAPDRNKIETYKRRIAKAAEETSAAPANSKPPAGAPAPTPSDVVEPAESAEAAVRAES